MTIRWDDARQRASAALATLHVGIEPALLALLAETGAISPGAAGWVVGAGQFGMSAGALLCWRFAKAARRSVAISAAILGTGASLDLAVVGDLTGVLVLRLLLGVAMGLLFARATAMAARDHPHRAVGIIMLGQQLLASAVMIALPMMAMRLSASAALATLAAVPLVVGLLAVGEQPRRPSASSVPVPAGGVRHGIGPLVAMSLLIAATLMVWSYIGAVGALAGVSEGSTAMAIAVASLASAPAALLASLTAPRHAPWVTTLGCGLGIVSPLLLPSGSGLVGYLATMTLFNASSTFAVIRLTAWAMAECTGARERRRVVLVQCVSIAGGAPLGALAMQLGSLPALASVATLFTIAAVLAPLGGSRRPGSIAAAPLPAVR